MSPNSNARAAWNLVSIALMLYDSWIIPFGAAFAFERSAIGGLSCGAVVWRPWCGGTVLLRDGAADGGLARSRVVRPGHCPGSNAASPGAINALVDVFFGLDILLRCCCYTYMDGGQPVMDRSQIYSHYRSSWLRLDVLAWLPFDLLVLPFLRTSSAAARGAAAGASAATRMRWAPTQLWAARLPHLFRLARFGEYFRVLDRNMQRLNLGLNVSQVPSQPRAAHAAPQGPCALRAGRTACSVPRRIAAPAAPRFSAAWHPARLVQMGLARLLIQYYLVQHWFACIWMWLHRLQSGQQRTWATEDHIARCHPDNHEVRTGWGGGVPVSP